MRFADGLAEAVRGGDRVLIEVGPGRTLSSLARQGIGATTTALPTLRHPREPGSDVAFLLQMLGRLWLLGVKPDWSSFWEGQKRRRISLPSYPFERQRYWIERGVPEVTSRKTAAPLRKTSDVGDWFYLPSFRRALVPPPREAKGPWLVFLDGSGIGERLASRLPGPVIRVMPGRRLKRVSEGRYIIGPGHRDEYDSLIEELRAADRLPENIVHLWALPQRWPWPVRAPNAHSEFARFNARKELCFDSLLFLAQALGTQEQPITLSVVSNQLFSVAGEPVLHPDQALLLGPVRVIPRELRHIRARNIDMDLYARRDPNQAVDDLARELQAPVTDPVVVYRGSERWVQSFDHARLPPAVDLPSLVRPRGVYLITGGLGGIGLEVAEHLAKVARARLVLIGRTPVPPRAEWDAWLAKHATTDLTSHRIRKLRAIEEHGGEPLALSADVTDRAQMEGVLAAARERFGTIHGVVHAAGTIDDGLIAMKSQAAADAVISVKAKGALLLQALLADSELDFFAVFSSVSSILGLEGQIDYTAANAFLDAFAQRICRTGGRGISVNWSAWQEVGMAVALAERGTRPGGGDLLHPMLGRLLADSDDETVFVTSFNRTEHWLVGEHVVRGADALIPGTGYLELARAVLEHRPKPRPVRISDVLFLSPFAVSSGETRELRMKLQRKGPEAGEVVFFSRSETPRVHRKSCLRR